MGVPQSRQGREHLTLSACSRRPAPKLCRRSARRPRSSVVESYVAASPEAFDDACDRARRAAETASGIRYVDTTYLPGDETVLHLFDAPSVDALDEAGRRAGLEFERIVPAVNDRTGERKENRDA